LRFSYFFIFHVSMDTQAIWQAALGELELTLSKANFTTWFKNTFISSFENNRVIIAVPNTFTKAWLEKKYHESIVKSLRAAANQNIREVTYRVEVKNTTILPLEHIAAEALPDGVHLAQPQHGGSHDSVASHEGNTCDIGLNPRYVFEQFIVGKGNELAHAASMAVAAKPGQTYNPLFIYGGVGMGKTHLLQAIGHHLVLQQPQAKVRYVTCERFTNEFIQAVRSGRGADFKETYRTVDLLLIDDIQFLTGKEGTQEEFFHTFNTLHQNNKQIVIASDRPPKDIPTLESRLLSRFEWGMMADISKPDFETRVAILQAKSREKQYPLSIEIMHSIAGSIQSNIRELEGALNKIIAYHQFKNLLPSTESVQTLLQSFAPTITKRTLTPRHLLEAITHHYDISMEDILGKSREQRFALPRQIAMFLLREEIKCSYPAIGHHIGNRDHTTAMHACDKINTLLKTDEELKRNLGVLREKLYSTSSSTS
jgi:chromosomal replication initiator protein